MAYLSYLLVTIELYLVLALSLNLLVGYTGLVSLCHAAFYGVGAYTAALTMKLLGWGFVPAVGVAVLFTMLLGALVALPSLRLRDDYFIVATIAFQTITYRVLYNLDGVTGGSYGLSGIPPLAVLGRELPPESPAFVAVATLVTALVVAVLVRLARSPFGRVLRAVRDDEAATAALGRSVAAFKVKAFLVGSAAAAVAGALFAVRQGTLIPTDFTIEASVLVLTALIVGGSGNVAGPLVGAVVVALAPEPLRFLGDRVAGMAGELQQILFGLMLIVLMRLRPQGLAGDYRFE